MASLLGSHVPSLPPRNLLRKNKKVSVHLRNFFTHEFAGGATGRWREAARGATQEEKLPRQTALLNLGVPEGKVLGGEALFLDKNTNDGMHDWALRDHDATTESQ